MSALANGLAQTLGIWTLVGINIQFNPDNASLSAAGYVRSEGDSYFVTFCRFVLESAYVPVAERSVSDHLLIKQLTQCFGRSRKMA